VFRCVLGSEGCVLVPRSSGTPVATWAWPTWVVSRRRVLEALFILLEFPSPSRRIFIGSHSLLPSLVRRIGPSKVGNRKRRSRGTRWRAHLGRRTKRQSAILVNAGGGSGQPARFGRRMGRRAGCWQSGGAVLRGGARLRLAGLGHVAL
jgi:hypothetical protein